MSKKVLLWLDDARDPFKHDVESFYDKDFKTHVEWIKSYQDAIDYVMSNGMPDIICFDHDIADEEKTGYDFAKWIVKYHMVFKSKFPKYYSQSSNPVGKQNILSYLNNYVKIINEQNEE